MNMVLEEQTEQINNIPNTSCEVQNSFTSPEFISEVGHSYKRMKLSANNSNELNGTSNDSSSSLSTRLIETQPQIIFSIKNGVSNNLPQNSTILNCQNNIYKNNVIKNNVQIDEDVINALLSLQNSFFSAHHPKQRKILPKINLPQKILKASQPEKMIRCSTCKKRKSIKCFGEKKNGILNRLCLECSLMKCKYYDSVVQKHIKDKYLMKSSSNGNEIDKIFKLRRKKYNRNKINN